LVGTDFIVTFSIISVIAASFLPLPQLIFRSDLWMENFRSSRCSDFFTSVRRWRSWYLQF